MRADKLRILDCATRRADRKRAAFFEGAARRCRDRRPFVGQRKVDGVAVRRLIIVGAVDIERMVNAQQRLARNAVIPGVGDVGDVIDRLVHRAALRRDGIDAIAEFVEPDACARVSGMTIDWPEMTAVVPLKPFAQ